MPAHERESLLGGRRIHAAAPSSASASSSSSAGGAHKITTAESNALDADAEKALVRAADLKRGLSSAVAADRLAEWGYNELAEKKRNALLILCVPRVSGARTRRCAAARPFRSAATDRATPNPPHAGSRTFGGRCRS